ncbi:MAG: polymer-forming cytoskeletal protein [Spirochaetales bacterium]|nr:polymer-forming cytoskeletal protein [Spirochaetales bacterium]
MSDTRDVIVNTLVGAGSSVAGDLVVAGMLRIDGDVAGAVRASGKVVVGGKGRVGADIQARSAIIGGLVKGDVVVLERAVLLEGAVVIGNVFAPAFDAAEGSVVHGDVRASGAGKGVEEALLAFMKSHGTRVPEAGPGGGDFRSWKK